MNCYEFGFNLFRADVDYNKIREQISELNDERRSIDKRIEQLHKDYSDAELGWFNITHNLNKMAAVVGLYEILWPSKGVYTVLASQMIPLLERGIKELESDPEKYRAYNAPNGWGKYEDFVRFCRELLQKCNEYPDSIVERGA